MTVESSPRQQTRKKRTPASFESKLFFNPKSIGFNDNPYPHYERLREEDPIHKSPIDVWFVGKYEDARFILKDPRFRVQDIPGQLKKKSDELQNISDNDQCNRFSLDALIANSEHWFAFLEPPGHTRLRGLFTKAFQKHTIERIRGFIRISAQELLAQHITQGHMDYMQDFACRLPLKVISHLMGIPNEDYGKVVQWVETIAQIFDPMVSIEEYQKLDRDSVLFIDYLRDLIQVKRREPQDDLISSLIGVADEQGLMTDDELISSIIVVFGAGEETVVNLLGNGIVALIENKAQLELLLENPELMPDAVDELLRYDAPLQMTSRTALEDVVIRGKRINKGDQVYVVLASANRDPDRFANPDQLDITRQKNHHLSFADGLHICVGAQMARIEAQEAFKVVLENIPDLSLQQTRLAWREHTVLRGMRSLPVTFLPRERILS